MKHLCMAGLPNVLDRLLDEHVVQLLALKKLISLLQPTDLPGLTVTFTKPSPKAFSPETATLKA